MCLIHLIKILAYKKYYMLEKKTNKIKCFDSLTQSNPNCLQTGWFMFSFIFFFRKSIQTNPFKFDWVGSWVWPNSTQTNPLRPLTPTLSFSIKHHRSQFKLNSSFNKVLQISAWEELANCLTCRGHPHNTIIPLQQFKKSFFILQFVLQGKSTRRN